MPKIIFRLLLSFIVFVTIFIVIRQLVIPISFGDYGHYRANSIEDNKGRTLYFKGDEKCISCHQDLDDLINTDVHSEISCETCHPPKIDANTDCKVNPPKVEGTIEFCAQCHTKNAAREAIGFPNFDIKEHKGDQNCIECHNPHAPWELKE
ncbi:hypothetical protein V8G69_00465 [Gaetbulibacter sp. M235]|uniref:hypothetical protein n=1 Tax=Gaetbulibacter sp. M235 TaxID=3126510 RepID=UPI00374F0714